MVSWKADQEWLALDGQGYVAGIPAIRIQEQVLVVGQPQQGRGFEMTGFLVARKHDRVLHLQFTELNGKHPRRADIEPLALAISGQYFQVLVRDIVK